LASTRNIEDVMEPYPLHYRNRVSLAKSHPEVAIYWLHKKNCGFGPEDFSHGSGVKAWWFCPKGSDHIYQQVISDRVNRNGTSSSSCPFCAGVKVSVTNSLASLHPALAKEWVTKLNKSTPDKVTFGSKRRCWWQCHLGHTWQAEVYKRTSGAGCPRCYGETTDLRNYPKVLRQFDRNKNKEIDPYRLTHKTKAWWRCHRSKDHVWYSTFCREDYTDFGIRCPFCRGKKASATNNLTLNKALLKEFHPTKNKPLKPEDITLGTHRRIWWICRKGRDHEWQVSVKDRIRYRTGCPFCTNRLVSETNCLATLNPKAAREFHPAKNKPATPRTVIATSLKRYWWQCKNGHIWQQRPYDRTTKGTQCRLCRRLQ